MRRLERQAIPIQGVPPQRSQPTGPSSNRPCPCCRLSPLNVHEYSVDEIVELERVGRGGFCEVHKVEFEGRVVARKRPYHRGVFHSREEVTDGKRLVHEAKVLMTFNHPNIIRVYGCTESPPQMFMEYHGGGDLHQAIRHWPELMRNWSQKVKIARQIASAMKALHRRGDLLCHGDLRSPNILLSSTGDAIVSDAGMAKYKQDFGGSAHHLPEPGGWNHTRDAPEVILNGTWGQESDVYSYGIILWELLTGKDPFDIQDTRFIWCYHQMIARERMKPELPEDLTQLPGWRPELQPYVALIERCWNEYTSERPTFEDLELELRRIHQSLGPESPATTVVEQNDPRISISLLPVVDLILLLLISYDASMNCAPADESLCPSCDNLPWPLKLSRTSAYGFICIGIAICLGAVLDRVLRSARFRNPWSSLFDGNGRRIRRVEFREPMRSSDENNTITQRSPFDIGRAPGWDSRDLQNRDPSVLMFPPPHAEQWEYLRAGLIEDLVDRVIGPKCCDILHFCVRHNEGNCPSQAEWESLMQIFVNNPDARAIPFWARYEEHRTSILNERQLQSSDVPLNASTLQSLEQQDTFESTRLEPWEEEIFRHRQVRGEDCGLSTASTGSITLKDWAEYNLFSA